MAKTTKKTVDAEFTVTVNIEGRVYEGKGASAVEALKAVPAPDLDFISSGSVVVKHGDKSKEMFFPQVQMKRLLNPYNQEVLANDLFLGM